jgi:hypothetical protein
MDVTDVSQKEKIETFSEMRVHNRETAVAHGTHCSKQVSLRGWESKFIFTTYIEWKLGVRCFRLLAVYMPNTVKGFDRQASLPRDQ